jgi:phospholipid/cholesterol/gamma-HCH transport system ATP-binding protein
MKNVAKVNFKLRNLSFVKPNGSFVFQNLSYELPPHGVLWIKGSPGSGKSVLLRMMAGLLEPKSGEFLVDGESFYDFSFEEALKYKIQIGYGFDFGGLINNRTLYQNLALPLDYHQIVPVAEIEAFVLEYLKKFDLQDFANERPSGVAGGIRKAVCVLRALIASPQLVLLDDPTTGLRGPILEKVTNHIKNNCDSGHQLFAIATDNAEFMRQLPNVKELDMSDQNAFLKTAEAS